MPRSRSQDTRRRLRSVIDHLTWVVLLLDEVIPGNVSPEEMDARYQYLTAVRAVAADMAATIETILEGRGEGREVAPNS